jgi:lysophospholipid acyltransferase (LPLAT)-like uncharacterized protein
MTVQTPEPPIARAPQMGLITVHEPDWRQRCLAWVIYFLVRMVVATIRFRWADEAWRTVPQAGRPYIFCTWHNRLPLSIALYEQYAKAVGGPPRLAAIVSASRDGAMMSAVLKRFGVLTLRGSSSRRGAQVLLELGESLGQGYDVAFAADGPRGPLYSMKVGVIVLAQMSGRALVPAAYHLSSKFTLKSWDRFQIPLPFSTCTIRLGGPVPVPRRGGDELREKIRAQVESALRALTRD